MEGITETEETEETEELTKDDIIQAKKKRLKKIKSMAKKQPKEGTKRHNIEKMLRLLKDIDDYVYIEEEQTTITSNAARIGMKVKTEKMFGIFPKNTDMKYHVLIKVTKI